MAQLTDAEMVALTGAKTSKRQIDVLNRNFVRYIVRADGSPTTTWEAINDSLIGRLRVAPPKPGFNLEAARSAKS